MPNLKLSNKAHKRLEKRHLSKYQDDFKPHNLVNWLYHANVAEKQERLNRVLSKSERKKVYKTIDDVHNLY